VAVLGDVAEATSGSARPPAPTGSEAELAEAFTDVLNTGDCWRQFAANGGEPSAEFMASRAVELYRLTEPWVLAGDEDGAGLAARAAAGALRAIADGYAMLARQWSPAERADLPLPQRADDERTQPLRRFGVYDWAAAHGYPLALPQPAADAGQADFYHELLEQERSEAVDSLIRRFGIEAWAAGRGDPLALAEPADAGQAEPDDELLELKRSVSAGSVSAFVRFFLTVAYTYDLLVVLCDSPTGRQALRHESFRQNAASQIADARKWVGWLLLRPELEDAFTAATVSVLIAQGFFLAACGAIPSGAALLPGMRERIREAGVHHWVIDQDVELPRWLAEDD
jgi:hypothetical protein